MEITGITVSIRGSGYTLQEILEDIHWQAREKLGEGTYAIPGGVHMYREYENRLLTGLMYAHVTVVLTSTGNTHSLGEILTESIRELDRTIERRKIEAPPENKGTRIGTTERMEAADKLQQHFGEGRLPWEEFDRRVQIALAAEYAKEIPPLFSDLPELKSEKSLIVMPPRSPARVPSPISIGRLAVLLIWLTFVIMIATHGGG